MIEEYPDTWPIDACRALDELKAELNQCIDCCKRVGELETENNRLMISNANLYDELHGYKYPK